jgi:hypothetical protein
MSAKLLKLTTLATLVLALNVSAQTLSPKALDQRMVERRAVDAVIWGMPIDITAQDSTEA